MDGFGCHYMCSCWLDVSLGFLLHRHAIFIALTFSEISYKSISPGACIPAYTKPQTYKFHSSVQIVLLLGRGAIFFSLFLTPNLIAKKLIDLRYAPKILFDLAFLNEEILVGTFWAFTWNWTFCWLWGNT